MHENTISGYADYRLGERVAKTEARLDAAEATSTRLEEKIDKLLWWIMGTLVSAAGSLVMTVINMMKHG